MKFYLNSKLFVYVQNILSIVTLSDKIQLTQYSFYSNNLSFILHSEGSNFCTNIIYATFLIDSLLSDIMIIFYLDII